MRRLVSIGIPVRNGEKYIEQALDSILSQTHEELEVVIGDNASTDGTEAICRRYVAADPRVRYFRHASNVGAGPNHNFVVEQCTGDYFRWATHDDVCAAELVERCVDVLERRPEVVLVYPRTRLIDGDGRSLGDYDKCCPWEGATPSARLRNLLLAVPSLLHKCYPIYGVMRMPVLRQTPLIAPYNSSDAVLLVELALRGHYHEIPDYLFFSRRHADSSLQANTSPEEVAAWFDPDQGIRFPAPRSKLLLGYLGAVYRVPLSLADRAACVSVIGRWMATDQTWRVVGGELKIKAREIVGEWRGPGIPARKR